MSQLVESRTSPTAASPEILVFPGDPGWEDARSAWNLAVDQRPAAVARPRTVDEVVAAVDHARALGLRVAVQATGHGAGHDLGGTLLVNTTQMRGVEIDPVARTARVAAGALWIDVVDAAVPHGLTALHGSAQDVGVVGYSLGGGIGWLSRKHGLASSSVLSAQVVKADGEVVHADQGANSDLFWALRGGGGGFGVVTEVEIALFPVTEAYAGWLVWPMERASDVLAAWSDWTAMAPEEVTSIGRLLQLPPIPEVPAPLRGRQVVVVEAAFLGDESVARELLRPLRELRPELDTFATLPARGLTELHRDPPGPSPGRGDGWLLDAFDGDAAAAIVAASAMDGTSPLVSVELRHLGGALGRPDPNGGVLSHIPAPYLVYAVGVPFGPDVAQAIDGRIAEIRAAVAGWRSRSTYLNFAERDVEPSTLYPNGVYDRLAEIRASVDPDGLLVARHALD